MASCGFECVEESTQSARKLALLRTRVLEEDDVPGLASIFVPMLETAFNSWLESLKQRSHRSCCDTEEKKDDNVAVSHFLVHDTEETQYLNRLLRVHAKMARMDPTLSEELGRQGSHHLVLSKLIRLDASSWKFEEDQDALIELQDLAAESMSGGPLKFFPFTLEELKQRLPLSFHVDSCDGQNEALILIRQVTERQSAQEDVGFVMWPSAVALSRWLITNPQIVQNKSVLEIGAGCGLVGLLAAHLQTQGGNTTLTDFNPTVIHNLVTNIELNGLHAEARKLDFYQQSGNTSDGWLDGFSGERISQVDLLLAADMICQPADAVAAANTIHDALKFGGEAVVICGDNKHRFGVDHFQAECTRVGLSVRAQNVADLYHGRLLDENMHKTAGYVEGMSLTMFRIIK